MSKTFKKGPLKRRRVSLEEKVNHLLKNNGTSSVQFTFVDGTTMTQELTEAFTKGKKVSMIIADIKAIQHDLGAKYFVLS